MSSVNQASPLWCNYNAIHCSSWTCSSCKFLLWALADCTKMDFSILVFYGSWAVNVKVECDEKQILQHTFLLRLSQWMDWIFLQYSDGACGYPVISFWFCSFIHFRSYLSTSGTLKYFSEGAVLPKLISEWSSLITQPDIYSFLHLPLSSFNTVFILWARHFVLDPGSWEWTK